MNPSHQLALALRRLHAEALARGRALRRPGAPPTTDALERALVAYADAFAAARPRLGGDLYRGEIALRPTGTDERAGAFVRLSGGGLPENTQAPPDPELVVFLLLRDRLTLRLVPQPDATASRLARAAVPLWSARVCEPVWALTGSQVDEFLDGHVSALDALPVVG
jgi:hypothetical protein